MIKRKGQIVPKSLACSVEKKAQHLIKFGCDVRITGRVIEALTRGSVIHVPYITHVLKKKQQRTWKGLIVKDLEFRDATCD